MELDNSRGKMRLSPTAKAVISLMFSLAVLGTAIWYIWQNIVIPFRSKPARPNFETTAPSRSP